jgi:3-hydroxyacyl-[acyl-carrier-protein] dehydratase
MGNVSLEEGRATAEFVFPETFKGFQGHFPGNPIVPGVCLVQCALVLAGAICKRPLQVRLIKSAKFLATVSPGQPVQVECSVAGDRVVASFASGETRIASLKVRVADA